MKAEEKSLEVAGVYRKRPHMRRAQAAEYLGMTGNHLAKLACWGSGPPFMKIGGIVLYDADDIDAWLHEQKVRSTSEYRARRVKAR